MFVFCSTREEKESLSFPDLLLKPEVTLRKARSHILHRHKSQLQNDPCIFPPSEKQRTSCFCGKLLFQPTKTAGGTQVELYSITPFHTERRLYLFLDHNITVYIYLFCPFQLIRNILTSFWHLSKTFLKSYTMAFALVFQLLLFSSIILHSTRPEK